MKEKFKDNIWIGIDVGTTGVRAIAYKSDAVKICASEEFYPLITLRTDWAEESPWQIYEAVEKVIKDTIDKLRYKNMQPAGIALSTVMHSFVGLDEKKQPLMNIQTWADSRSSDIVYEMKKNIKLVEVFYKKTCCPIHACYPLAKILWLREHQIDIFRQMKYIGSLKDYLFYKLTGKWCIDHSTASTSGLYNVHTMMWDNEILDYAGIDSSMLPEIVSTTHSESISKAFSQKLNIGSELPVVIGATDGVLVNVGIGAVNSGQISATIGTSGAVRMLTEKPMIDKKMRTWCYNLTDNMWVCGGAINNGGMILRWLRDKIIHYSKNQMENLDVDPYDLMTLKASKISPGSEGLILLPFFTGERAPYWNSELRGLFFGLSLNHGRSHMIRATMEGICYSLNSVYKALQEFGDITDIIVSGSFTKSDLWVQILADILEKDISLPKNSEGAAFGAAVLGFIASGEMKSIKDTANIAKIEKVYRPIEDNKTTYENMYSIFSRLYLNLQAEFADIVKYQKNIFN